ncbi:hypothetical protein DFH08DRAFT_1075403 [Mycena albidolilacea]|uniref:Uncharacterized protein n=1 Tax=Mycena albidolilacea TaxID=1033008 RepID=A0AAD7AGN6_9AGAR|nr:hypothetical protein DFH08DRAFT_1075403 [Mycena albidolilacea]
MSSLFGSCAPAAPPAETSMSLASSLLVGPQSQSFEEIRMTDYLNAYRTTGRPPPPSPAYPTDPAARAAQEHNPFLHRSHSQYGLRRLRALHLRDAYDSTIGACSLISSSRLPRSVPAAVRLCRLRVSTDCETFVPLGATRRATSPMITARPPRAPALAHIPAPCLCAFPLHVDPPVPPELQRLSLDRIALHVDREATCDRMRVALHGEREGTHARTITHARARTSNFTRNRRFPCVGPTGRGRVQNPGASWTFETLRRRYVRDCRGWCPSTVRRHPRPGELTNRIPVSLNAWLVSLGAIGANSAARYDYTPDARPALVDAAAVSLRALALYLDPACGA